MEPCHISNHSHEFRSRAPVMISVNDSIAIVGMSGLFPGALDTSTLWANVCAKFDSTRDVSPGRWIAGPEAMLRPGHQPDKTYSARCCLLPDFRFDPAWPGPGPGLRPIPRPALPRAAACRAGSPAGRRHPGAEARADRRRARRHRPAHGRRHRADARPAGTAPGSRRPGRSPSAPSRPEPAADTSPAGSPACRRPSWPGRCGWAAAAIPWMRPAPRRSTR